MSIIPTSATPAPARLAAARTGARLCAARHGQHRLSRPTLQQEHYSSASTISVNGVLLPVSALPVDTPAAIALGAKPLKPERSTNFSVGMVFTAIPRLTVTVDAYQIKISDRILLSETLQGSTVLSVLQSAGILNSAGASISPTRPARARAGWMWWQPIAFRKPRWALQSQPVGQSQQDDLHPHRRSARCAEECRPCADRPLASGRFHPGHAAFQDHRHDQLEQERLHRHGACHALWFGDADLQLLPGHGRLCRRARCYRQPQDAGGSGGWLSIEEGIKLTAGANNLFNIYPDKLPTSLQSSGFSLYNPYAPYGFSGGFYYGRINFTF
jgi:iron complex outermembrane receptor protein